MMEKTSLAFLESFCTQIRRDILRMVHAVNSGHPGGSLGTVEFFAVLFKEILQFNAKNFNITSKGEDAFFLSNGHISPVYYSILARCGYFPLKELSTFRKIDSRLQGHPTNYEKLPGVRISTGSLGQGLSVAIGVAEAKKLQNDNHLVYTLLGDGELQEGQIWEAVLYAGAKKVDRLIACVDWNGCQIDGFTKEVMNLGDLKKKFEAFDWKVIVCEEGNSLKEVFEVLTTAKKNAKKTFPQVILLKTAMGHGVDFMMGTHAWHGIAPNDEQLQRALKQNPISKLGDFPL